MTINHLARLLYKVNAMDTFNASLYSTYEGRIGGKRCLYLIGIGGILISDDGYNLTTLAYASNDEIITIPINRIIPFHTDCSYIYDTFNDSVTQYGISAKCYNGGYLLQVDDMRGCLYVDIDGYCIGTYLGNHYYLSANSYLTFIGTLHMQGHIDFADFLLTHSIEE